MKKSKTDNQYKELETISDEVIDFINKHAEPHVVSDEYKNTEIFQKTETDDSIGEEFTIISDEVLDFITNNAKRHIISEKNKCRRIFLEPSEDEKISREEVTFFTSEEEHYLDTHDNSVSGEIRNFTLEDLKMFDQPKGEIEK